MKNDPLVAKLYNKMQQEQNEYRAWLLAQPLLLCKKIEKTLILK